MSMTLDELKQALALAKDELVRVEMGLSKSIEGNVNFERLDLSRVATQAKISSIEEAILGFGAVEEVNDEVEVDLTMPNLHVLKIAPEFLEELVEGKKRWEIRQNDRNFQVGDILLLRSFGQAGGFLGKYTLLMVTEMWMRLPGLEDGYVILDVKADLGPFGEGIRALAGAHIKDSYLEAKSFD